LVFQPNDEAERQLRQAESEIDLLHDAIIHYLVDLGGTQRLNDDDRAEQIELFYLTNRLEHLSDTVIKVADTLAKLRYREFEWTPNLTRRMHELLNRIEDHYTAMAQAIAEGDADGIRNLVQAVPELRQHEGALRLYILTHGGEFERHALAAVLELSDDLAVLTGRIGDVGRAALGIV
jgi:Na+/phosphate symporter